MNKKFISIIIAILLGFTLLTGCTPAVTPPPTPPTPQTATLTVYSSSASVWGYVWVNGFSTGQWLDYNGAVTITGLSTGLASVQIVDNWGVSSHVEYINLVPGQNILNFTYW